MNQTARNISFKFPGGIKARDAVSGFEGIITSRVEFLNGCRQYCITPKVDKEGKKIDGMYFDEDQVEALDGDGRVDKQYDGPVNVTEHSLNHGLHSDQRKVASGGPTPAGTPTAYKA